MRLVMASYLLTLALLACGDAAVVPIGSLPSCKGHCGKLVPGRSCQCISWCHSFNNCCRDYYLCGKHDAAGQTPRTTLPPTTLPPTTLPPTTLPPTTLPPTTLPPTTLPPTTLPPTTLPPTTLPPTTLPPTTRPPPPTTLRLATRAPPPVTTLPPTLPPTATQTSITTTSRTTVTTTSRTTLTTTSRTTVTTTSKTTVTTTSKTTVTTTSKTTVTTTSKTTVTTTSKTTVTTTSKTSITTTSRTTLTTTSKTTVTTTRLATVATTSLGTKAVGPIHIGNYVVPAKSQCSGFGPKEITIRVRGIDRRFFMFLPSRSDAPLWLLFHGTRNMAMAFLKYSRLHLFAIHNGIGFVALQGLPNKYDDSRTQFNVGPHSQPTAEEEQQGVHDLEATKEILGQVLQLPCIDKRRVHCAGYSNGARFCMRLASEMSDVIASVAPVSGLRYPEPNHAGRPIPVLAFHGQWDPVNPWEGNGDEYWKASVPDALQKWALFNQCSEAFGAPKFAKLGGEFSMARYQGCKDDATVELIRLDGAGHQWPNALWAHRGLGKVARVDGNVLIREFFSKHRLPEEYLQKSSFLSGFEAKRKLVSASWLNRHSLAGHSAHRIGAFAAALSMLGVALSAWLSARRRSGAYHELRGALIDDAREQDQ